MEGSISVDEFQHQGRHKSRLSEAAIDGGGATGADGFDDGRRNGERRAKGGEMEDEAQRVVGVSAKWWHDCKYGSVQVQAVRAAQNDVLPTPNEECG